MSNCEKIATSTCHFLTDKLYNDENGHTLKAVVKNASSTKAKVGKAIAGALLPVFAVAETIARLVVHFFLAVAAFFVGITTGTGGLICRLIGKQDLADKILPVATRCFKWVTHPLYSGVRDSISASYRSIKALV